MVHRRTLVHFEWSEKELAPFGPRITPGSLTLRLFYLPMSFLIQY